MVNFRNCRRNFVLESQGRLFFKSFLERFYVIIRCVCNNLIVQHIHVRAVYSLFLNETSLKVLNRRLPSSAGYVLTSFGCQFHLGIQSNPTQNCRFLRWTSVWKLRKSLLKMSFKWKKEQNCLFSYVVLLNVNWLRYFRLNLPFSDETFKVVWLVLYNHTFTIIINAEHVYVYNFVYIYIYASGSVIICAQ